MREAFKRLHMEKGEGTGGALPLKFLTVRTHGCTAAAAWARLRAAAAPHAHAHAGAACGCTSKGRMCPSGSLCFLHALARTACPHKRMRRSTPVNRLQVNVDKVPALEANRGHCQPLFQFYKDGRMLDKVEGVEITKLVALTTTLSKK